MVIESTRFGPIDVPDEKLLAFPDGLIGLPGDGYTLLEHAPESPFLWLQSTVHSDVAVPVTVPWRFVTGYDVRVPDDDARRLALDRPEDAQILCVVRASERTEDFTINLAAPIILHRERKLGRQIINDVGGYSVRHPLFTEAGVSDDQPAASVGSTGAATA